MEKEGQAVPCYNPSYFPKAGNINKSTKYTMQMVYFCLLYYRVCRFFLHKIVVDLQWYYCD